MSVDIALETILNSVLKEVSVRCDFVHAEAFKPAGTTCMVQGGACYSANSNASDFHKASLNFHYPQYACMPGRVWKTQQTEWHQDASALPMSIFVRAELARVTELRACFAIPLCRQGHVVSVVIFYSRSVIPYDEQLEHTVFSLANDILSEVCTCSGHPQMYFTKNGKPASSNKRPHAGTSKVWESAKVSLALEAEKRNETDVDNIIKFSKRLPFFKYVTTASREALCRTMQLVHLNEGEVAMRGPEDADYVWYIVVKGRCDMLLKTEEGGKYYPMRTFEEGDTFAYSYVKMLSSNSQNVKGDIRAVEPNTMVVRVYVEPEYRSDFRSQTKPLLHEELAKYFDMSADEAAERLGVCMSAIKKICRRHGIVRWPHRKLLSANKSLALIDSKSMEPQSPETMSALRAEAINVLVSKLRVMLNPSYISSTELIQVDPKEAGDGDMRVMGGQIGSDSDFDDRDDEPSPKRGSGGGGAKPPAQNWQSAGSNGTANGQNVAAEHQSEPKVEARNAGGGVGMGMDGGDHGRSSQQQQQQQWAEMGGQQSGNSNISNNINGKGGGANGWGGGGGPQQGGEGAGRPGAGEGGELSIEALSQLVHGALEKVPAYAREQVLSAVMNGMRQGNGGGADLGHMHAPGQQQQQQQQHMGMPGPGGPGGPQRSFNAMHAMPQQAQWNGQAVGGKRGAPGNAEAFDSDSSDEEGGPNGPGGGGGGGQTWARVQHGVGEPPKKAGKINHRAQGQTAASKKQQQLQQKQQQLQQQQQQQQQQPGPNALLPPQGPPQNGHYGVDARQLAGGQGGPSFANNAMSLNLHQQLQNQLRGATAGGPPRLPGTHGPGPLPSNLMNMMPGPLQMPNTGRPGGSELGSIAMQISGNDGRAITLPRLPGAFQMGGDGGPHKPQQHPAGHVANIHLLCDLLGGPPGEQLPT